MRHVFLLVTQPYQKLFRIAYITRSKIVGFRVHACANTSRMISIINKFDIQTIVRIRNEKSMLYAWCCCWFCRLLFSCKSYYSHCQYHGFLSIALCIGVIAVICLPFHTLQWNGIRSIGTEMLMLCVHRNSIACIDRWRARGRGGEMKTRNCLELTVIVMVVQLSRNIELIVMVFLPSILYNSLLWRISHRQNRNEQ